MANVWAFFPREKVKDPRAMKNKNRYYVLFKRLLFSIRNYCKSLTDKQTLV